MNYHQQSKYATLAKHLQDVKRDIINEINTRVAELLKDGETTVDTNDQADDEFTATYLNDGRDQIIEVGQDRLMAMDEHNDYEVEFADLSSDDLLSVLYTLYSIK